MNKTLKSLTVWICIWVCLITQISCSSSQSTNTELEALTVIGSNSYLVAE